MTKPSDLFPPRSKEYVESVCTTPVYSTGEVSNSVMVYAVSEPYLPEQPAGRAFVSDSVTIAGAPSTELEVTKKALELAATLCEQQARTIDQLNNSIEVLSRALAEAEGV